MKWSNEACLWSVPGHRLISLDLEQVKDGIELDFHGLVLAIYRSDQVFPSQSYSTLYSHWL